MDYYLAQHPEIFMAPAKESHYFAPDISTPEERWSEDKYFSMFAEARDELYVGESSVFYMMSEAAAERIRAFCPEARILIFLRNPIDFIEFPPFSDRVRRIRGHHRPWRRACG